MVDCLSRSCMFVFIALRCLFLSLAHSVVCSAFIFVSTFFAHSAHMWRGLFTSGHSLSSVSTTYPLCVCLFTSSIISCMLCRCCFVRVLFIIIVSSLRTLILSPIHLLQWFLLCFPCRCAVSFFSMFSAVSISLTTASITLFILFCISSLSFVVPILLICLAFVINSSTLFVSIPSGVPFLFKSLRIIISSYFSAYLELFASRVRCRCSVSVYFSVVLPSIFVQFISAAIREWSDPCSPPTCSIPALVITPSWSCLVGIHM